MDIQPLKHAHRCYGERECRLCGFAHCNWTMEEYNTVVHGKTYWLRCLKSRQRVFTRKDGSEGSYWAECNYQIPY